MSEFKFELGSEAVCKITGFKGIIRGRTQYLTGCNTYGVQSQELKDNKPADWVWFDEGQLETTSKAKITLTEVSVPKGGPLDKSQVAPVKA